MDGFLTLGIPCRVDEPGLEGTLESLLAACQHPELPAGLMVEMVICINGLRREEGCLPLTSVRDFCARHGVPVKEVWLTETRNGTLTPALSRRCAGEGVISGKGFIVLSPLGRGSG